MEPVHTVFVYTPEGSLEPALAIAASRAGAVGVLDAGDSDDSKRVAAAIEKIASYTRNPFGLRLGPLFDKKRAGELLDNASSGLQWLILDAATARRLATVVAPFRRGGGRLLVQVHEWQEALADMAGNLDGWVVKGREAGGFGGASGTLGLVGDVLAHGQAPVYAYGGIGPHTAPACLAAGCAGFVLADQLLLLREACPADATRNRLEKLTPDQVLTARSADGSSLYRFVALPGFDGREFVASTSGLEVGELAAAVGTQSRWSDSAQLLSAGVDACHAARWAGRYVNVAGALRALSKAVENAAALVSRPGPDDASSAALRLAMGTQLPVVAASPVDGTPRPALAGAAAADGALALYAATGATADEFREGLAAFVTGIDGHSWGVALCGNDDAATLTARATAAVEAGATLAILSPARVDQALMIERLGLPAFIEVSASSLLPSLVAQGVRHFVLRGVDESSESPSSFGLWESMADALLEAGRHGPTGRDVHVLFAGSVHDTTTSAAASTFSHVLGQRRIGTGILVQEAYGDVPESSGEDLGRAVSAVHTALLDDAFARQRDNLARVVSAPGEASPAPSPSDIAVIGIGGSFPGATSAREFWENVVNKVDVISEIPPHRWDWRLYFDEDRTAADKIYSRWGGFLDDMPFDPVRYGMPPNAVKSVDPMQLMTLDVIRRTLEDAGYGSRDFDRDRVSVILGASGGTGDVGAQYTLRSETARFAGELPPAQAERLPQWTEDSFAGILLNVSAGRAANRFDFGGLNYTVDSACASSLTAVYQAVSELESGRSDMVIAGGVDTVQGPFGYLCFSKTQALSPRGRCSTFDTGADGIVISEGIAMLVLKRLADAERDGDRIYAVIKGTGGSSDGRAKSMTAPHPDGQIRALERAYRKAGFSPATVGLFEAHGTGTVAGDTAELETVTRLLRTHGAAPKQSAIGSVKTLIGHTKATAGVAGLIKSCLALHHKVLPPHANVSEPNPKIADPKSPLYLVSEAEPWVATPDRPRRAGVSAFGFGGTNFHVALEEYNDSFQSVAGQAPLDRWPSELFIFRAQDRSALVKRMRAVAEQLDAGASPCRRDLALTLVRNLPPAGVTAALVVREQDNLSKRLGQMIAHVENPDGAPAPPQGFFSPAPLADTGKTAVIFAGQGSQYPNMMRQIALAFPAFRKILETSDELLRERIERSAGSGARLSRLIYPGGLYSEVEEKAAAARLTRTEIAQPAIGVVEAALWAVMQQLGLEPHMAAGHSYGEYAALYSAGVFDLPTLLDVSEARGRFIVQASEGKDLGVMAAARTQRADVERIADQFPDLLVANHNAPEQSILSGSRDSIETAVALLQKEGIDAQVLPVGAAFHSSFVAPAQELLAEHLAEASFHEPAFPVYSNTTAAPHEASAERIRATLSEHLAQPVEFVAEIEAMYAAGARIFVGLGPKNVQSSLVDLILGDRPHRVARIDDHVGGLNGLLCAVAALMSENVPLDPAPLFAGRDARELKLDRLADDGRRELLPNHVWMLNGAGARRLHDPVPTPLTLEQVASWSEPAARSEAQEPIAATQAAAAHSDGAAQSPAPAVPRHPAEPAAGVPAAQAAPAAGGASVLMEFQATLQQFLEGNERVMMGALAGGPAAQPLAPSGRRPPRRLATRAGATPGPAQISPAVPPDTKVAQAGKPKPPVESAPTKVVTPSRAEVLPRFVMCPQVESASGLAPDKLEAGAYLITEDNAGVSTQVALLLGRLPDVIPVLLRAEDLADSVQLDRCLAAARERHGAIRGVLHLAPISAVPSDSAATLEDWQQQFDRADKSLFRLLKHCSADLRDGGRIVAASALGGLFGRGVTLDRFTAGGGATGMLKSLHEEWPSTRVKAVDLDAKRPADENAQHLVGELRLPGGRIEVGYRAGVRRIFRTVPTRVPAADTSSGRTPAPDWVVLASGGARGITAELIRDLAEAGVTLVLTGRTPEPTGEDPGTVELASPAELRSYFIAAAKREGGPMRPVEIQRRVDALLRDREMAANLADLRDAGATVEYRVCDMTDPKQTTALFEHIYGHYGRLDGVVHGAGIIDDKLIEDKTEASWYRVFDTKVDSVFLLSRHLQPETLKFVVLFTSVAGRYGNSGQTDYAAANEIVNRIAWYLQGLYGAETKVSAINWGPWENTRHGKGMVSADTRRKFESRGVRLVPAAEGRALFMHEITRSPVSDVEVIAGQGPWEEVETDYGRFREGTVIEASADARPRPLLTGATIVMGAGDRRIVRRTIRRSTDLYLDQHPIKGTPVLPAAVALEMMAETAATVCPGFVITEMSQVRLLNGIRFEQDDIDVRVEATIGMASATDDRIVVDLAMYQETKSARPSYRARAHLNGVPLEPPVYQSLIRPGPSPMTARDAYRDILFHGPCLQTIKQLEGLDAQGAVATLRPTPAVDTWFRDAAADSQWLFDPGCVDGAAQMGLIYSHLLNGNSALPNQFGRIRRFGDGPKPTCRMFFLAHPEQPEHRIRADVAFVDEHGRLRLFVEQLEMTASPSLNSMGGGWKGEICV